MPTSKEYRQQAKDCMNLASEAEELFVKTALTEMAADFEGLAEKLQQRAFEEPISARRLEMMTWQHAPDPPKKLPSQTPSVTPPAGFLYLYGLLPPLC
jgi:hypothetical protein